MNRDHKNSRSPLSVLRSAALAADFPYRHLITALCVFFLTALISDAVVLGTSRPFAAAATAAAEGFFPAAGALAGALLAALGKPELLPAALGAALLFFVRVPLSLWLSRPAELPARPEGTGRLDRLRGLWQRAAGCSASEGIRMRMLLSAASVLLSGCLTLLLSDPFSWRDVVRILVSAAAAPLLTGALCTLTVRSLSRTSARDAGVCVLLFAAVRALRDARGLPFAAETAAAFAASVLAVRMKAGPVPRRVDPGRIVRGVTVGVAVGFAVDVGGPPLYAAAALAAGLLFSVSPAAGVCGGWICACAVSFAGGGLAGFSAVMPELTVTAALLVPLLQFGLIPAAAADPLTEESRVTAVLRAETERGRADLTATRMHSLSAALRSVSGVIGELSEKFRRPPASRIRQICGEAFDARCAECENRILCRERECAALDDSLCRMSLEIRRTGRVSASAVSPSLARRCHRLDGILSDIEERWSALARSAQEGDKSDVLAEDYAAFAALLEETVREAEETWEPDAAASERLRRGMQALEMSAGEITVLGRRRIRVLAEDLDLSRIRMENGELRAALEEILECPLSDPEYRIDGRHVSMCLTGIPRLSVREGDFSRAAEEETDGHRPPPNGDCVRHFETDDGRYYMLICDGMGTGGEAALTARLAASFLEQVLSGGAQMNASLSMLNGFLRHRGMESSAGLDLMEIDRYTGEARFVKSGAAPSFVLRKGRLFRLCSKTVPIGILRALDAEMIRFPLQPGDSIVMLSDGVSENFEDSAWLCDMLASPAVTAASPRDLAEKIVRAACAGEKRRDDVTAAVVRVMGSGAA